MEIFKNCLLASDVDGTLVGGGKIAERNIEAIKYFRENGGTFVLSTGRGAAALGQVFTLMDKSLVGPSIVLNGGMIYDSANEKVLYAKELSNRSKENALTVCKKLPTVGVEIHSNTNVFVLAANDVVWFHGKYEMLNQIETTFDQIKNEPWHKVLYCCASDAEREALSALLDEIDTNESSFVCTRLGFETGEHIYYEQLPKGMSKAVGVRELAKILNTKKGGIFAIGDYYNDVEMLQFADISGTTSQAPNDIKKLVNFVGGPCNKGAVADFIEYLKTEVQK